MTKTIIFDFDETLVNSRDVLIRLYNELAVKYNFKKFKESDIPHFTGISIRERCKLMNVPFHKLPLLVYEAHKDYRNYLHSVDIKKGIAEVLYKLKEYGFILGIISSNATSNIKEFLHRNNLDIFKNIYSARNLFGKHYAINAFLKKYYLKKEDTLYIGDEVRDIISCKKSGVKIIAVTWGLDSIHLLQKEKPDFIANNPNEIIEIVNKFWQSY